MSARSWVNLRGSVIDGDDEASACRLFKEDYSSQGTITSFTILPLSNNLYAYNTDLSNLSTYTKLNIDNLKATSTSILNNLNSYSFYALESINSLNSTSTTINCYNNNNI
jgi:hypothetical protein